MKILTEKVVTDSEAKKILERVGKEGELKYEQKNALDHLKKFVKTDPQKIKTISEEMRAVERLRDRQIAAIVNFLPQDREDLRAVLHKEYTSFSEEEIEKILEIVRKI